MLLSPAEDCILIYLFWKFFRLRNWTKCICILDSLSPTKFWKLKKDLAVARFLNYIKELGPEMAAVQNSLNQNQQSKGMLASLKFKWKKKPNIDIKCYENWKGLTSCSQAKKFVGGCTVHSKDHQLCFESKEE